MLFASCLVVLNTSGLCYFKSIQQIILFSPFFVILSTTGFLQPPNSSFPGLPLAIIGFNTPLPFSTFYRADSL